jgi:hypothetical protein
VDEIDENEWTYLTRTEKPVGIIQNYNYQIYKVSQNDSETGEPLGIENIVEDTPLLINIKGCG